MHAPPSSRFFLLAMLVATVASAKERVPQIRNVTFPHRPDQVARPIYVAGEIATVLHFEQNVEEENSQDHALAALRPDGTPGPEECPEEAFKAMRYLQISVGDGGLVTLDVNQTDTTPITLYDGPVESMLEDELGPLEPPTRLYGRVWTSGPSRSAPIPSRGQRSSNSRWQASTSSMSSAEPPSGSGSDAGRIAKQTQGKDAGSPVKSA